MKNDLLDIFGDELRKFAGLSRKQRLCVLYFCMSFGALLSVFFIHPLPELFIVVELRKFRTITEEACPFE